MPKQRNSPEIKKGKEPKSEKPREHEVVTPKGETIKMNEDELKRLFGPRYLGT
jgi:hypothetical protein